MNGAEIAANADCFMVNANRFMVNRGQFMENRRQFMENRPAVTANRGRFTMICRAVTENPTPFHHESGHDHGTPGASAAGEGAREGGVGEHGGRPAEPSPCWKHLSEEGYRARVVELVREINESAAVARAQSLMTTLGADGARAQNPETRPRKIKKSPAPFFHALRKKVRKALWEAYGLFFAAFREAAKRGGPATGTRHFLSGAFRRGCRS